MFRLEKIPLLTLISCYFRNSYKTKFIKALKDIESRAKVQKGSHDKSFLGYHQVKLRLSKEIFHEPVKLIDIIDKYP